MAFLPRPVTRMMLSTPEATASSTPYWMIGLSTSGSISFGWGLVAGRNRDPRPATGNTALRPADATFTSVEAPGAGHDARPGSQPFARPADQAARHPARRHRIPADAGADDAAKPAARER